MNITRYMSEWASLAMHIWPAATDEGMGGEVLKWLHTYRIANKGVATVASDMLSTDKKENSSGLSVTKCITYPAVVA